MNPIAIVHAIVAAVVVVLAMPLVRRRVPRNSWYGVRIPESLKSDDRWYELNEYGGRLLIYWAAVITMVAAAGLFVEKPEWNSYAWLSSAVILAGLAALTGAIYWHAAKTKKD